ncbi:MAG: hypothetical protein M3Q97_07695 [Bacteroidota bacterium]|nr:hypothetical protein [Bacteroidota bacterium]
MNTLLPSHFAYSIAASENYIVVCFERRIAIFKRIGEWEIILTHHFSISRTYNFLHISGDYLVMGDCYFYNPKDQANTTAISVYNLRKNKSQKEIHPEFDHIEFSRFAPNHWISACSDKILFSNTSDYKITIYNMDLKPVDSFTRQLEGWVRMPEQKLQYLRAVIPQQETGMFFDSFSVYNDHLISRVEGAWFLNDTTILVRYYKYDSTANRKLRYFDVYRQRKGVWTLTTSDIIDCPAKIDVEKVVSKANAELMSWNYYTEMGSGKIAVFRGYADIAYLGGTWKEIKISELDYYKENDPLWAIFIYRFE